MPHVILVIAGSTLANYHGKALVETRRGSTTAIVECLLANNTVSEGVLSGLSDIDGKGAVVSLQR